MVGFLSFGDFGYLGFLVDGVSCRWMFTVQASQSRGARRLPSQPHDEDDDVSLGHLRGRLVVRLLPHRGSTPRASMVLRVLRWRV